jgi:adenylate cyclase
MRAMAELRRRRVPRVAAIYIAAAWGLEQLARVVAAPLDLPGWATSFVLFLVVLGFPVAVVLAWAFDLERGGLVRTGPGPRLGRRDKLAYLLLLGLGTALLVWLLSSHWADVRPVPGPRGAEAPPSDQA